MVALMLLILLLQVPGRGMTASSQNQDPTPLPEKLLLEERAFLEAIVDPQARINVTTANWSRPLPLPNNRSRALSRLWEVENELAQIQWGTHAYGPSSAAHVLLAASKDPDGAATGNKNPRSSSRHASSIATVTAAAAAAFESFAADDDTCDAHAMGRNAVFEMAQMILSWELAHKSSIRPSRNESAPSAGHYEVSPGFLLAASGGYGCKRWLVQESESFTSQEHHRLGGSSFLAEIRGGTFLRMCGVANFFNGSYIVSCRRPDPGTCADVTVDVEWEDFQAYRNPLPPFEGEPSPQDQKNDSPKQRAERAHRGGFRKAAEVNIFHERICEPNSNAAAMTAIEAIQVNTTVTAMDFRKEKKKEEKSIKKNKKNDGWVKSSSLQDDRSAFAAWQRDWIWRFPDGNIQHASFEREESYRQCFGIAKEDLGQTLVKSIMKKEKKQRVPLKAVYFFGSSHLSYMVAGCLTNEIFNMAYNHKLTVGFGPDDALNGLPRVSREYYRTCKKRRRKQEVLTLLD